MNESTQRWLAVCRVEDVPRLGARRFERAGLPPVAVFRAPDDAVFALVDRCPHQGGPLSQGIVFARSVSCPLHNWSISLEDGCARAPDAGCTPRLAVHLAGGVVHLDLAQLESLDAAVTDA